MAEVGWTGSMVEERGRFFGPESKESSPDGYVLLDVLGDGHFGEVFRAYDPLRDQIVALKRFYLADVYDVDTRKDMVASARVELEAASRIRHPGLARVFAMGYDPRENLYVVQEFVKGKPLRALMEGSTPPDPLFAVKKTQFISSALAALHKGDVVHRDLKPENILLRAPDEAPVLVDFGIAYVPDFEGGFGPTGIQGTLPFIAPELLQGEPASCKADIYSLGVVLYEWLARRLPWDSKWKDWSAALHDKLHVRPTPLTTLLPEYFPEFTRIVDCLMNPDPQRRPSSTEVAQVCKELLEEAPLWSSLKRSSTERKIQTTNLLLRADSSDSWADYEPPSAG
jgi:serine/threonine-protein kinase